MLILISPAKTLDFESPVATRKHTQPEFVEQSEELIDTLRSYTPRRLSKLMNLSDKLSMLNVERYQQWEIPFSQPSARQALFAFRGDVYLGLDADSLSARDITYAQKHLRILSGLHGVLRPLDLIRPHRLEMGTQLKNRRGKNLYAYWSETITESLNSALPNNRSVVFNLASQEYFKSVDTAQLKGNLITPLFKDLQPSGAAAGRYRTIGFFAKRARGRMARHIIENRITTENEIKKFKLDGYRYNAELTASAADHELVFTRDQVPET